MPSSEKTVRDETVIYWSSYLLRCFVGLSAWLVTEYWSIGLLEDAAHYEAVGVGIAREWITTGTSQTLGVLMEHGRHAWVMYALLAVFSFVLGGIRCLPLAMILLNLVTAWVPVYTYRIGLLLGVSRSGALRAARIVVFSPVFAFWSGAAYKEGLVLLALNLTLYEVLRLQRSFRARSLLVVVAALTALLGLRFYMPILLIPGIGIGILLGKAGNLRREKVPGFLILRQGAVAVLLLAVLSLAGFVSRVAFILPDDSRQIFTEVQWSRDDLAGTQSGFLVGADVSTPERALAFLPRGIVHFLVVPFPWQLGSFRQALVAPEMLFWLMQYPLMFLGMITALRSNFRGTVLVLTLSVMMLCFYGLFVGNAGTVYRLRAQVWLLWVLFTGWYKDRKANQTGRGHPTRLPAGDPQLSRCSSPA